MKCLLVDNGTIHEKDSPLTLRDLQAMVGGGYIEGFMTLDGEIRGTSIALYCNEDGIAKGLAPNVRFPEVLTPAGWILGPIVIAGLDDEGENRSLTPQEIGWFTIDGAKTLKVEFISTGAPVPHGACPKCGCPQFDGTGCSNDECPLVGTFA